MPLASYSPTSLSVTDRRSFLDRFLSVFGEVRAGEGVTAVLLMFNVFLLLTAYYIIKPVRESLILTGGGAEIKSYAAAGQALLLLLIVPAYGSFASKVNRIRLINGVTLFFISNLILFYLLARFHVPLGIVFFLWAGIFNLMVVAQFWAFANDLYTPGQGKRLFAIVGFGSSVGAVVGAQIASWLFKIVGAYQLMLVAAGTLAACVFVANWVNQSQKQNTSHRFMEDTSVDHAASERPLGKEGGFQLVIKERYLLLIALMTLVLNLVNTTGEFILGKTVSRAAHETLVAGATGGLTEGQIIGQFYANYFFWANLLGAALQLFALSRIYKYVGVRGALFVLPLIAVSGYGLLAFVPVLSYIRIVKILENGADYSVQNTSRQALFLPTSREAKYKAKAAIDSFFWRMGDSFSALLVFIGTQLSFSVQNFALANVFLVILWLLLTLGIVRQHQRLTQASA